MKKQNYWLEIIGSIIMLICLVYVVPFLNNLFNELYINSKTTECHEIYGSFGSYVGGILGAVIGFVTLFFVYLTYTSQRKELKLQGQLIAQQQFESTFFNMLNVHRELKNSLKLNSINLICKLDDSSKEIVIYGLDVIQSISSDYREFYNSFDNNAHLKQFNINKKNKNYKKLIPDTAEIITIVEHFKVDPNSKSSDIFQNNNWDEDKCKLEFLEEKINFTYKFLYENYQNQISHYCRNVYHILKYIRENEKNQTLGKDYKKYKNYANIFQSQLNVDEQFLLFYNFIHFNDKENGIYSTLRLVNYYKFLENIGIDNLILKKHEEFYDYIIKGSDRKIKKHTK